MTPGDDMTESSPPPGTDAQPARPPHGRASWRWWALAAVAVVLGAAVGMQLVQVLRPAAPPSGDSAQFAQTGGIFTRGNGTPAPGWSLPELTGLGRSVTLRQFRGRPVVVNFWASWCTPCREEMPALEQVSRLLAGRVALVGLDTQDQQAAGLGFAHSARVTYPLGIANAQVWSAYGVQALPSSFFISAQGTVLGIDFGGMTTSSLLGRIRQLYGITPRGQDGATSS